MVVRRKGGEIEHRRFRDLPEFLRRGDLLVLNDTRVIRGRLRTRRETGGAVEIFLLGPAGEGAGTDLWEALARPSRRLRKGMVFAFGGILRATLVGRTNEGTWAVRLEADGEIHEAIERVGEIPLPPYIRRGPGGGPRPSDRERYQTVYAEVPGSVAAPTAGLHFDREMLEEIVSAGIAIARVTLAVGYGTFSPIRTEEVEEYRIHPERYRLPPETAAAVEDARKQGGRVIAVGTTSVRVLEQCGREDGRVDPGEGMTRLFLYPGCRFRVVDAMITNFHLPRSSLLALVMAFAGPERIRAAYGAAVAEEYRFFSYGDAMLLL
ncbi:MAG: tRNA preQ1(34) S-adenosylmethionine ribosyltransferase-isomerase QueA [Deltaproteobacteria bacterium]